MSHCTLENRETASVTQAQTPPESPVLRPTYHVRPVEGAYEVGVVLPGVAREDITVRLDDSHLYVEGRRPAFQPEGWRELRREIGGVTFQLDLRVTVPLDANAVSARLENGILSLRLPLREEAKPKEIVVV